VSATQICCFEREKENWRYQSQNREVLKKSI